jgi:hypothetical protein
MRVLVAVLGFGVNLLVGDGWMGVLVSPCAGKATGSLKVGSFFGPF